MSSTEKIWSWAFGDPKLSTGSPILHDFDSDWFFHNNTSVYLEVKTSSALPPYYSLELAPISSTSHFVILSISDGFGMFSLWISNPWRDFLPGDGSRSLRGWNFTQNSNFIKDVTGRNKNYQVYINFDRAMFSSFRLRLELSLCMRASLSSHMNGKLSKWKTNAQKYQKLNFLTQKYPTCLLIVMLKLAAPCRRITL